MLIKTTYRKYIHYYDDTINRTHKRITSYYLGIHMGEKQTCRGIKTKLRIAITSAKEEENVMGESYTKGLNYYLKHFYLLS